LKTLKKVTFVFFLSLLSIFVYAGCSKTQNAYLEIQNNGSSMYPTIPEHVIYYKQTKKVKSNDVVVIENSEHQYWAYNDLHISRIIAKEKQTVTFFLVEEYVVNETFNKKQEIYYVYDVKVNGDKGQLINIYKPQFVEKMQITKTFYNNYSKHPSYTMLGIIFKSIVDETLPLKDRTFTLTLNDDELFVMSDNRNHAIDSRYFGVVNKEDICGIVDLSYNGEK